MMDAAHSVGMKRRKVNPEVTAAFTMGVVAGAAGVWLMTSRQIDVEHRQAVRMAGAAQHAQAMGRMDIIRAQQAASFARREALRTVESARKEARQYKQELETARQTRISPHH